MIRDVLSKRTREIGVWWKDGMFYPSGAEELDKSLIGDTLTWLKDYPSVEKYYRMALDRYKEPKSLADVMTNCYKAVEGMAQNILGNDKNLDKNRNALLARIGLSDKWKAVVANYVAYMHDHRHTRTKNRYDIAPQEVEACLYLTGLIIRLAIRSTES